MCHYINRTIAIDRYTEAAGAGTASAGFTDTIITFMEIGSDTYLKHIQFLGTL